MSSLNLKGIFRLKQENSVLSIQDHTIELIDLGVAYTTTIHNTDQLFLMLHLFRQSDYAALKHQFKRYKGLRRDEYHPRGNDGLNLYGLHWRLVDNGYRLTVTGESIDLTYNGQSILSTALQPTIGAIHRSLFLFVVGQYDQIVISFTGEKPLYAIA